MNHGFRKYVVSLLILIYSIAAGVVVGIPAESAYGSDQGPGHNLASLSQTLVCPAPESSLKAGSITCVSVPDIRSIPHGYGLPSRSFDKLLRAGFNRYTAFAINFPIRIRKGDLIFPFHSFW